MNNLNYALILAGGIGTRIGNNKPKQFLKIGTEPILVFSIRSFENSPLISKILLVIEKNWIEYTYGILRKYKFKKILDIIKGGERRQDSSYIGVSYLGEHLNDNDILLIHDASRPFISQDIIKKIIKATEKFGAAVPVLPIKSTILKMNKDNFVGEAPDRKYLFLAQTPQTFRFSSIYECHRRAKKLHLFFTDDVSLLINFGYKVKTIPGDEKNIKITTGFDLNIAKKIYKNSFQNFFNNK